MTYSNDTIGIGFLHFSLDLCLLFFRRSECADYKTDKMKNNTFE